MPHIFTYTYQVSLLTGFKEQLQIMTTILEEWGKEGEIRKFVVERSNIFLNLNVFYYTYINHLNIIYSYRCFSQSIHLSCSLQKKKIEKGQLLFKNETECFIYFSTRSSTKF